MKRFTFLSVIAALLCVAVPAQADTYLSEVTNGLESSPVYVAAGTEGTDGNTAGALEQQLNSNDNIVLVMLPADAESQLDGGLESFAKQLSGGKSERIVGIVVGEQAIGYASSMPTGVAADLMHRAESVSTNNVEILTTYVRNVHEWQRLHPEAKTTGKPKPENPTDWVTIIGTGVAIFVAAMAILFGVDYYKRNRTGEARKRFKAPNVVSDQLGEIAQLRDDVRNPELRDVLFKCCTDLERYFGKYSSDHDGDAITFEAHLTSVLSVLNKYIEVQNNPRDYNKPEDLMQHAEESLTGFGDFVINSIRNGNDARLLNYRVDTKILKAQSFR